MELIQADGNADRKEGNPPPPAAEMLSDPCTNGVGFSLLRMLGPNYSSAGWRGGAALLQIWASRFACVGWTNKGPFLRGEPSSTLGLSQPPPTAEQWGGPEAEVLNTTANLGAINSTAGRSPVWLHFRNEISRYFRELKPVTRAAWVL